MRLLYFGQLWRGSTCVQRIAGFRALPGVEVIALDQADRAEGREFSDQDPRHSSLFNRIRWRLGIPADVDRQNERLLAAVAQHGPQAVIVDNSKVITPRTLRAMRALGVARLAYYSPDDIGSAHNLSLPLRRSWPEWDVVFTTKTYNLAELQAAGVRRPVLAGKAFDPALHRPLSAAEVGPEFEGFDAVFIGTHEAERCRSLNALAAAGLRVVVYGGTIGGWTSGALHPTVVLRQAVFGEHYVAAWHHGKVALCFLRRLNRDLITQRTMEIAACGRPMVAERTVEHDAHFDNGTEYLGFSDDTELVAQVRALLGDDAKRLALGRAARKRCERSGYSTIERARAMLGALTG